MHTQEHDRIRKPHTTQTERENHTRLHACSGCGDRLRGDPVAIQRTRPSAATANVDTVCVCVGLRSGEMRRRGPGGNIYSGDCGREKTWRRGPPRRGCGRDSHRYACVEAWPSVVSRAEADVEGGGGGGDLDRDGSVLAFAWPKTPRHPPPPPRPLWFLAGWPLV